MTNVFNQIMDDLLAETRHLPDEDRVAIIRPRFDALYDQAHKAIKARADAAHEARFGRKHGRP